MTKDLKPLPVIKRTPPDEEGTSASCTSCSSKSCCGGFGIKAGSEKDVVYRNVIIYLLMGTIIITVAYILKNVLSYVTG
ncbi:MAG: hypothetical protein U9N13_09225 [Euryarchaeota archaeon]|nr:hypothetical protein [Euryarchaeota archaeon]